MGVIHDLRHRLNHRGPARCAGGEVKFFLDTEFLEDGKTIDLLSIGVVAEDGREFYRQNTQCDVSRANYWVKANVLPNLENPLGRPYVIRPWCHPGFIRLELNEFLGDDKPEFWAYYGAYDWVALCQLWGDMSRLPTGWPMYCIDLRQWLDHHGLPNIRQSDDAPHHALSDARWIAQTYGEYRFMDEAQPWA